MYRQGDVLITRIDVIPVTAVKQPPVAALTLAFGEATGHSHTVEVAQSWQGIDGTLYFEIPLTGSLVHHQEHAPISLPVGVYKSQIQREYTPEAIRNVAD